MEAGHGSNEPGAVIRSPRRQSMLFMLRFFGRPYNAPSRLDAPQNDSPGIPSALPYDIRLVFFLVRASFFYPGGTSMPGQKRRPPGGLPRVSPQNPAPPVDQSGFRVGP